MTETLFIQVHCPKRDFILKTLRHLRKPRMATRYSRETGYGRSSYLGSMSCLCLYLFLWEGSLCRDVGRGGIGERWMGGDKNGQSRRRSSNRRQITRRKRSHGSSSGKR